MPSDDLFRRSFEAGTAFLDMTRQRAEALVNELVKAGEVSRGRAQRAVDELLERSRKGTDELRELIRREIAAQLSALGVATNEDISRLEQRLDAMARGAGEVTPPTTPPGTGASARTVSTSKRAAKASPVKAAKAAKAVKAVKAVKVTGTKPGGERPSGGAGAGGERPSGGAGEVGGGRPSGGAGEAGGAATGGAATGGAATGGPSPAGPATPSGGPPPNGGAAG